MYNAIVLLYVPSVVSIMQRRSQIMKRGIVCFHYFYSGGYNYCCADLQLIRVVFNWSKTHSFCQFILIDSFDLLPFYLIFLLYSFVPILSLAIKRIRVGLFYSAAAAACGVCSNIFKCFRRKILALRVVQICVSLFFKGKKISSFVSCPLLDPFFRSFRLIVILFKCFFL